MDDEVTALRREVRYLRDRQDILDCIARHARGHDRHDADLLTATYHDDAVDEHGGTINEAVAYAEWANSTHALSSSSHLHHVSTHTCEIDGDVAHCESYVLVVLLDPEERTTTIMAGRYVDRLERRDGEWRIALRRTTVDAVCTGDASMLHHPAFRQQGYLRGTRDRRDVSYQRPLTLDDPDLPRW